MAGMLCMLPAGSAVAQPDQVSLTNGRITAVLDTFSGRFSALRADGRSLLFLSGMGMTSHVSFRIGDVIWTNHGKSQMTAPWPQRNLGRGQTEVLSDRLRHTWQIAARGGTMRVGIELEPVSDSLYEELRVHLFVENMTVRAQPAGMTVMQDVDADGDDYVTLSNIARSLLREQTFTAAAMPERFVMLSSAFLPDSAHCRFTGQFVTAPDRLIVGRWAYHGGLGTAVYGYEAVDRVITDAAVLLQWNTDTLAAGGRRLETTAIGFSAPEPPPDGWHTFAREFSIPLHTNAAILTIISDSVSMVRVHAPFTDAIYEASPDHDMRWDTTVLVTPDKPVSLLVHLNNLSVLQTDSLTYYRQLHVKVTSDKQIAVNMRDLTYYSGLNGTIVWPDTHWDTLYLMPGVLNAGHMTVNNSARISTVTIDQTIEYLVEDYSGYQSGRTPVSALIRVLLPPHGAVDAQAGYGRIYNHWAPRTASENLTFDGAGDVIRSEYPVHVSWTNLSKIWPGNRSVHDGSRPPWEPAYFHVPPRTRLGTEYVFVPFRKSRARTQQDFVRVIAYEDDTEVCFFDGTPAVRLDRSGHVDTLIDRPTVIRANKPVAVYQHHLTWSYLDSDTTYAGSALPLLPHGLWGRRYYSVTDDAFRPNVNPLLPQGYRGVLYYDNLYLILVTKATTIDAVAINDVPVDASRFTVFGDWAYAYIDIAPGYHIVRSDHPFLAISCGGGGGARGKHDYGFGVSFIPPYR